MAKAGQSLFSIIVIIQLLVTGVGLGLSSYILSLAPTLDNVLSIVFVSFTGFALLTTIVGLLGGCSHSKCLLKCHGLMGIVSILIFAIIAILSGLWYGGIDVLPDFEFSGRNVTELCQTFDRNEFLDQQNNLLIDEIQNNALVEKSSSSPQIGEPVDPTVSATITTTAAATGATVETSTSISTTTASDVLSWSFDEGRILLYYCQVEGFVRDIIFGRRTDGTIDESGKSSQIMLGILIVSCILFLFYLISTFLAFRNAKRVSGRNFYS